MDEPKAAGPLDEQPGSGEVPPEAPFGAWRQPTTEPTTRSLYRVVINIIALVVSIFVVATLALLIFLPH